MSLRQTILRFCVILLLVLAVLGGGQRPVHSAVAMVITVDSTEDLNDFAPGNSVCSAKQMTGGPCTLRAAITEANLNIATPNQHIIIKISPGEYKLTIPPDYLNDNDNHTGDLNIDFPGSIITNTVTIEPLGSGPVVIRSYVEDRVLSVNIHAEVILNNLTMRDGNVLQDTNNPYKGGGAILNYGKLSLNGVALLANTVSCRNGTGCAGAGGALENWGNLTILDSTLDGNTARQGGAIFHGGTSPYGNLTITYSTLSNNHTANSGTILNYSKLTILNSTFSGNTSAYNSLSGIHNLGTLSMQSTTMANVGGNSAIFNGPSGITTTLKDNIFKAESGYTNCTIVDGSIWTSGGYNIANDNTCRLWHLDDMFSEDLQLGSFDYWGGPTKTIMLNPGSPAIDHRKTVCLPIPANYLVDDQRHWPRNDGKCDTGAFEYHGTTDVGATKVWMPSKLMETLKVAVNFQLYRKTSANLSSQTVGNPVAVTSGTGWKATWADLDVNFSPGIPYTYFVRETNKPANFTVDGVDDLTVTNTYYRFLFLPLISK